MFPEEITQLTTRLQTEQFQKLLKTDATTINGQEYVAEYFKVSEQWKNEKETNTPPSYFKLLKLVNKHSKEDHIWISIWEGMHRHVVIMLSCLCADITYDSTNCYIFKTLTTNSIKRGDIKGFADPKVPPKKLIQDIFGGKRSDAPLLKYEITITAYIPTMAVKDTDTIMEVMCGQSQSVSNNKLSSAMRTLSTSFHDCLSICISLGSSRQLSQDARPNIHYKITVQQAIADQGYRRKLEQNDDYNNNEDFGWYPECISNKNWMAFLKNPFDTEILINYTKQNLECKSKNNKRVTLKPPFLISFKHITSNTGTANTTKLKTIDARNMNAYQIIPGIIYTLLARLQGVVRATILNESVAIKAINFFARYCYATRAQPFNTMNGSCTEYGIKPKLYLNQCEGEDEAIPVTVLLVAMYNACYTFQRDNRKKLLLLALRRLDLHGGAIADKSLIATLSELLPTRKIFHF
jgi:hypothetical protein